MLAPAPHTYPFAIHIDTPHFRFAGYCRIVYQYTQTHIIIVTSQNRNFLSDAISIVFSFFFFFGCVFSLFAGFRHIFSHCQHCFATFFLSFSVCIIKKQTAESGCEETISSGTHRNSIAVTKAFLSIIHKNINHHDHDVSCVGCERSIWARVCVCRVTKMHRRYKLIRIFTAKCSMNPIFAAFFPSLSSCFRWIYLKAPCRYAFTYNYSWKLIFWLCQFPDSRSEWQ